MPGSLGFCILKIHSLGNGSKVETCTIVINTIAPLWIRQGRMKPHFYKRLKDFLGDNTLY